MDTPDEHQVLENLLLASSDVLCALGPSGHLWRVGVAGQRLLGYAAQELSGAPSRSCLGRCLNGRYPPGTQKLLSGTCWTATSRES